MLLVALQGLVCHWSGPGYGGFQNFLKDLKFVCFRLLLEESAVILERVLWMFYTGTKSMVWVVRTDDVLPLAVSVDVSVG